MDYYGIPIIESAFVAKDTIVLLNGEKIGEVVDFSISPSPPHWRWRADFSIGLVPPTRPERDPATRVPRRARDWPRWLLSIVAYEFRKEARMLRRYPAPVKLVCLDV